VSYAIAAYLVAIGGVAAYGAWLVRTRRQLEHELSGATQRNDG
jgi:CcmD family protein